MIISIIAIIITIILVFSDIQGDLACPLLQMAKRSLTVVAIHTSPHSLSIAIYHLLFQGYTHLTKPNKMCRIFLLVSSNFLPFCIGYIYALVVCSYCICVNLWCWYPKYSKQVGGGGGGGHLKWQVEKVKCSQRLFTHVCSMTLGPRILASVFKVTVSTECFQSKYSNPKCLIVCA